MAQKKANFARNIRTDELMSRHTSWRIGGPVDIYFKPNDREQLSEFLHQLEPDVPVLWVGLGSNLLVRDGGFRGAVIATHRALNNLQNVGDGHVVADAGVTCAKLAKYCVRWKYADAHFFAGIPGTVGGALAMNAGAFGGETWPFVKSVETIDRQGVIHSRLAEQFEVGYRSVVGRENEWFLAADFSFTTTHSDLSDDIKKLLARRKASQPIGLPSCGSVFRNPVGDHAARLIEDVGLKGHVMGGACVSDKHANFIINTGDATAADVEALIQLIIHTVMDKHGVALLPEVRIVGESL